MALRHVMLPIILIYSPGLNSVADIQQAYAKHRGPRTHHNNFFTLTDHPLFVPKSGFFSRIQLRANSLRHGKEQHFNSYTPFWMVENFRNLLFETAAFQIMCRGSHYLMTFREFISLLINSQILAWRNFGKGNMILNLSQPNSNSGTVHFLIIFNSTNECT